MGELFWWNHAGKAKHAYLSADVLVESLSQHLVESFSHTLPEGIANHHPPCVQKQNCGATKATGWFETSPCSCLLSLIVLHRAGCAGIIRAAWISSSSKERTAAAPEFPIHPMAIAHCFHVSRARSNKCNFFSSNKSLPCCLSKEAWGHSLPEDRLAQHSQGTEPELHRQASHLLGQSYIKEMCCSAATIIFHLGSICTLSLINLSLSSFSLIICRESFIAVLEYFQSYTVHKLLLSLERAVVLITLLMEVFSR